MAGSFNNIGGAEPSTITFKLGTVSHDRGSTTEHQEIVVLGGEASSLAVAAVLNTQPASTAWGLAVRLVDTTVAISTGSITVHQGSTLFSVQVSTGAVSVSTGSVTVHQGSTNFSVQVSTGAVSVSTGSVTVHQGSTLFSVQARNTTSSGGGIEGSTATPAAGVLGMHVRPVLGSLQSTTVAVVSSASTAIYELVSSAAGVRTRVFAFSVMSTVTGISTAAFLSSLAIERWGLLLGTGSSGITGANLAVSPPAALFETVAANALNFTATSTGLYRISFSYWQEP